MTTWKPVPSWEHRYEVSDTGLVRSRAMSVKAGRGRGGLAVRRGRVLKPVSKSGRYLCVTLAQGDRREQRFVHDLVLLAFVGPKPPGHEALHRDDARSNNALTNLRYGTKAENERDRQVNGRVPVGERHGCAKLVNEQVLAIRNSSEGAAALARAYNISPAHVWAIRNRRAWRHI